MAKHIKDVCKWITINDGDLIKLGEGPIVNPNPGQPFKVKFYLDENVESLNGEWRYNENVIGVNLANMKADDLTDMSYAFQYSGVENVTLPKNTKEDLTITEVFDKETFNRIKDNISGNDELLAKINADINKEIPEQKPPVVEPEPEPEVVTPVYELTCDGKDFINGETYTLTVKRTSPESFDEEITVTVKVTNGTCETTEIKDNGKESFETSLDIVLGDAETCKVELVYNDSVSSYEFTGIQKPTVEPEPEVVTPKYELTCGDTELVQGVTYTITVARTEPETLNETINVNVSVEGCEVDNNTIEDAGEAEFYTEFAITPSAETCKVTLMINEEAVSNVLEFTGIKTVEELAEQAVSEINGDAAEVNVMTSLTVDTESLKVTNSKTINLNGNSVDCKERGYTKQSVPTFVVTDGEITIENGSITSNSYGIKAEGGTTTLNDVRISTIDLDDETDTNHEGFGLYPLTVDEGAEVIINSGEYYGSTSAVQSNGGKVIINGGTFNSPVDLTFDSTGTKNFTLNIVDSYLKGDNSDKSYTDYIEVFGGKFIGFDPANPTSEEKTTGKCSFVADGYASIKENDGSYKVVKIKQVPTETKSITGNAGVYEFVDNMQNTVATFPITGTGEYRYINEDHTISCSNKNAQFLVRSKMTLNLEGNGTWSNDKGYGIWTSNASSVVNIYGGKFVGQTHAVYSEKGTINIYDGEFEVMNAEDGIANMLINCKDDNLAAGTANINIYGGKFHGFNPAENAEAAPNTSFVAEGYESVSVGENVWEVRKIENA